MLDPRRVRSDPDAIRAGLARRGDDPALVDRWLGLDTRRREILPQLEQLRADKNRASQAIAQAKRSGEDAAEAIAAMQEVGGREKALTAELAEIDGELQQAMIALPNPPADEAPDE